MNEDGLTRLIAAVERGESPRFSRHDAAVVAANARWDRYRAEREARAEVIYLKGLTSEQRRFVFELVRDLRAAAEAAS